MSNVIVIKKSQGTVINRDKQGAVIRITNEAADVLESILNKVHTGDISICKLASNLIEYAAKDTVIKVEDEE